VSKPGRIEGRLSSRPFKSDVSIVGIKARQNMVQLPILELSLYNEFESRRGAQCTQEY